MRRAEETDYSLIEGSPKSIQRRHQAAHGPNGEGEGWLMVKLAADKKQGGALRFCKIELTRSDSKFALTQLPRCCCLRRLVAAAEIQGRPERRRPCQVERVRHLAAARSRSERPHPSGPHAAVRRCGGQHAGRPRVHGALQCGLQRPRMCHWEVCRVETPGCQS